MTYRRLALSEVALGMLSIHRIDPDTCAGGMVSIDARKAPRLPFSYAPASIGGYVSHRGVF